MIHRLHFSGVGPAQTLGPIDFAPRLNLLTGDNGLGKSFVLDAAWWALTGSWPSDRAALPPSSSPSAKIEAVVSAKTKTQRWESAFDFATQEWPAPRGRPSNPGLVLYFGVNGEFGLWDPTVHYWKKNTALGIDNPERPPALVLTPDRVWNPTIEDGKVSFRGLIEDWVTWQRAQSVEFQQLMTVLRLLAPHDIAAAPPRKIWIGDQRDHPVLQFPYGDVPLAVTSAGMKRLLGAAYLLVWSWNAHRRNAELTRQVPEKRITILFDEPETHLHPLWQRRLLPGLLGAIEGIDAELATQFLIGTHSPLVLASLETRFDSKCDALFHFSLVNRQSLVEKVPWAGRGDVSTWLVSPIFGLEQARSVEAEKAIERAEAFIRGEPDKREEIQAELERALPGADKFWPRWVVATERP